MFSLLGASASGAIVGLTLTESNFGLSENDLSFSVWKVFKLLPKFLFFLGVLSSSEVAGPSGSCLFKSSISDFDIAVWCCTSGDVGSNRLMNWNTESAVGWTLESSAVVSFVGAAGGISSMEGGVTDGTGWFCVKLLLGVGLYSASGSCEAASSRVSVCLLEMLRVFALGLLRNLRPVDQELGGL